MKGVIVMKKISKMKKWWWSNKNKPITWGAYAKYTKWCLGITGMLYLIVFIVYKLHDWWVYDRPAKKRKDEED